MTTIPSIAGKSANRPRPAPAAYRVTRLMSA
jgi:hypothetical protein